MRRPVVLLLLLSACTPGGSTAPDTLAPTTTLPTTPTAAPTTTVVVTTTTATTAPMRFDPFGATILELQDAMAAGRLTSLELVDYHLDRIAAYDPDLTVFVTVNPRARDEARALDAERATDGPRGPLHGIPIVLKDNIDTADLPTTAGSIALAGFVPSQDAFQVARLRQAGAIILGKVNLQEWARSIHANSSILGRTRNPYDPTRNAGGSSAGTAVAVTTEMATAGLGTDTCGSIRIPAAYASLWGLRPTIGLSSRSGVVPLSPSEDTVGPLTRSVADLAVLLDATVGEDPADPTTHGAATHIPATYLDALDPDGLTGARIGVMSSLFGTPGPVHRAVSDALARMEDAGATLVPIEVPDRTVLLGNATGVFLREWRFAVAEYLAARPGAPIGSLADVLGPGRHLPETRAALERALAATTLDTAEYRAAVAARSRVAAAVTETMDRHDLDAIAYPTISISPAAIGVDQRGNNCAMASVGGLPALTMPAGLTTEGLPVGVELLGRAFDELTLLRLAAGYESAVNPRVPPPGTPPLGP